MVAVDTPENLTARLAGSETMYVQIDANGADPGAALARMTRGEIEIALQQCVNFVTLISANGKKVKTGERA